MAAERALDWVAISPDPLDAGALERWARRPAYGAVVTFCGTPRTSSTHDHDVVALEYETEPTLAEARLRAVSDEARRRWPELGAIVLHHRVGSVALLESAVVVVVSSPHRDAAFDAARFCIDALKRSVPMWKREVWVGGSAWSEEGQTIVSARDL
ncbi:MAG: molybdenum cofactor biosynthesis protein MoaE [Acidobacteriota bacterium]|nr:molybdenum cofactor biosynthesis protein MoaE [Acidobacteriota bacterium]MDE3043261.1 molybdenum cofactor biosynthesis protein MoaE [Acidobacteriota bacterium]MDE3106583.1 molybdenum cofactor biosynthesis protein MoaE [Acidobacteriota bacterium]MDE3222180.1 molybdenum cofactor biosynthesis protein MoaE [Acidobacteriota bacterium]